MKIKTFVQRHPLATYFGLAYAITWGGILLAAGATRLQDTGFVVRIDLA